MRSYAIRRIAWSIRSGSSCSSTPSSPSSLSSAGAPSDSGDSSEKKEGDLLLEQHLRDRHTPKIDHARPLPDGELGTFHGLIAMLIGSCCGSSRRISPVRPRSRTTGVGEGGGVGLPPRLTDPLIRSPDRKNGLSRRSPTGRDISPVMTTSGSSVSDEGEQALSALRPDRDSGRR